MSRLLSCLSVAALLLSAGSAPAQQRGKKFALLVGVQRYDHASLPNLEYTENDVEELGKLLAAGGFTVVVLTSPRGDRDEAFGPTAKTIRAQLKKLTDKLTKHDLLLVGLAGHGLQLRVIDPDDREKKKEKEESFFCPADARPRDTKDFGLLAKTMIPLGELFKELDESGVGVKLLLIDACRNDPKLGRNVDTDNLPRPPRGTAALFSCKGGEKAFETKKLGGGHGIFFYHVIQALRGDARNERGEVIWSRLVDHVVEKVSEEVPALIGGGARQTPQEIKNITGKSPVLVKAQRDPAEALAWYKKGLAYQSGDGVEKDEKLAASWYRKAAEAGHARAMLALGLLYEIGAAAVRDQGEALRWYRRGAEAGDAESMVGVGRILANGGKREDEKEAVSWFRRAAARGDPFAMGWMGWMHEKGRGVEKDDREAVRWYKKGSEAGDHTATYNLARQYELGRGGLEKDEEKAVELYRKAAVNGNQFSQYRLGAAYETGLGPVKKDLTEAARWYRKAADQGLELAKKALQRLQKEDL